MKSINYRASDSDLIALNEIGKHIHNPSMAAALRYSIQETFKRLGDLDFTNLLKSPIGAKQMPAPLPAMDLETGIIEDPTNPYSDWRFVRRGWDGESGEEYIVIRKNSKPFNERGIKESDPEWEHFHKNT